MMLKVFPDDDLRSTAHDRKKEQEKGIHITPTAMIPSISMLALPERGNVFVLGADSSRVGIDVGYRGNLTAPVPIKIYDVDVEDDIILIDLRLGGRWWMEATSKAIVRIAWKMELQDSRNMALILDDRTP
ncbi:hypothetical protein B296_00057368 [Ensete ventricosum]|uniref:Uncharacterized protein n=1 Tax=Ensete ventricosum TaxID=4639 RepID=A0A426X0S2_ENSVE|nr:hypothetical protein B296_00057368 [Ensete ventricosum]